MAGGGGGGGGGVQALLPENRSDSVFFFSFFFVLFFLNIYGPQLILHILKLTQLSRIPLNIYKNIRASSIWNMRGSRNFGRGGGGGSRPYCQKTDLTAFFFCFVFFGPQLILQFYSGLSIVYFKENHSFPRFQRGSNIFQGRGGGLSFSRGGPTFSRGGGLNANLYRKP